MNDETEALVLSLLNAEGGSAAAEATAAAAAAALAAQRADRISFAGRPPSTAGLTEPGLGLLQPGGAEATQHPHVGTISSTPRTSIAAGSASRRPSDFGERRSDEQRLAISATSNGGNTPQSRAQAAAILSCLRYSTGGVAPGPMPSFDDSDLAVQLPGAAPASPQPQPLTDCRPLATSTSQATTCDTAPEDLGASIWERPPLPPQTLSGRYLAVPAASLRPSLRRGSNSNSLADVVAPGALGTGLAAAVGDRCSNPERRGITSTSGSTVSDTTSTTWSRTPRSSLNGAGGGEGAAAPLEREALPAGPRLRSPGRAVSWQDTQQPEKPPRQQQQLQVSQQQDQQLQASQQQQQQQQQHKRHQVTQQPPTPVGRAVRFLSRDGLPAAAGEAGPGVGLAAGVGLPPSRASSLALPPLQRVNENPSTGTAASQRQGACDDAGPRTGVPGAGARRPSDGGGPAARKPRRPPSADGSPGCQPRGPGLDGCQGGRDPQAARLGAAEEADLGAGTPGAGGSGCAQAGDGERGQHSEAGSRRSTGAGLHGDQGGSSGPIRRARDLAPLLLPPGMDTVLRDALARAAAHNVALLSTGALLPEEDFGYARIVAQHRQHHQQKRQHSLLPPTPPPPAEPPARRRSLQGTDQAGAAAAAAAAASDQGPASSPSSSPKHKAFKPGLAAHSMRSVLKTSGHHSALGSESGGAAQPVAGPVSKVPSNSSNSNHSYRSLPLRRRSSLCSNEDSGAGGAGTDPESPPVAAVRSVNGGGSGGGAGGLLSCVDGCSDGPATNLLNEENVEVRIHCLTFNMGGVSPLAAALPESLFSGSYLSPDSNADAAHIYVVATQESGALAEWEAAVALHLGRRYRRVAGESLMSIHILLFAVHHLAPYIVDVRTSSVATGVGNVLGNKGGVAVTFGLLGAQVLLVGAHFAAHTQNVMRRNADFLRICAGLFEPPPAPSAPTAAATSAGGKLQHQQSAGRPPVAGVDSPIMSGQTGRSGNSTRRFTPSSGPALSRFSRGVNSAAASDSDPSVGAPVSRGLTRTLSSSSVSSTVSIASRAPSEAPSRSRSPSFWSGISFASAQRQSDALLAHFDVVLWMGDLNYRIAGNPEVVKYAIDHNMVEVLRANDQLAIQQKKGKVLQGFHEMPIAFAPTYKFTPGTDEYDLRRTPAWTDRVLYLVNADPLFADLRPLYYMSVPELRTSDHKPVIAGFELSISPQHAGANQHARHKACVIS